MAMRPAIIFVGPSLRDCIHESFDLIEFRKPAARGDLKLAAAQGARVIALIDGVFHQTLAVTPSEVRLVAGTGVTVLGGASLGALRACECPDAMQGVGEIWSAFARGALTDDDEVALTYDPDTHSIASYPLIQVRELARLAVQHYPDSREVAAEFVAQVRKLPFQERTTNAIRTAAARLVQTGVPWEKIEVWLKEARFDIKHRDALCVINAVVEAIHRGQAAS